MTRVERAGLCALAVALGGCGLKGPLYLPEKSGDVAIRPAPATTEPATPAEPAAPETSAPAEPPPQDANPGKDRG